jgi:hypothetical protein
MKELFKTTLRAIGIPLNKPPNQKTDSGDRVVLHKYKDYNEYVKVQSTGNKEKIDLTWVVEDNIVFLSRYLLEKLKSVEAGICHGTRRGQEQKWFSEKLNASVFGTEISDTASQFENTIQWDFHEIKPEWLGRFDFIYSNSFDHSYDPEKCLNAWISCLKNGGICIIEHSSLHSPKGVTELDPFGVTLEYFPYLVLSWSKGSYFVCDILDAPRHNTELLEHFGASLDYLKFVVIKRAS